MEKEQIIERLTSICKEVFENEDFIFDETLSVGNVDGWTSLTNMMLVAELEKAFDIKFKLFELSELDNLAAFVASIESHLA